MNPAPMKPGAAHDRARAWSRALLAAAIALLALWVYADVRSHAFVDFDDADYVFANPNLDGRFALDDLVRAFREPENSN